MRHVAQQKSLGKFAGAFEFLCALKFLPDRKLETRRFTVGKFNQTLTPSRGKNYAR